MTYSIKHKAAGRYGLVNENNEWYEESEGKDFLGTKEEAQAKAEELNHVQNDFIANSNITTGNALNGDEQPVLLHNQEGEDKEGLEETNEDDTRARARFTAEDQNINSESENEETEQSVKTVDDDTVKISKGFILTTKGWLAKN